MSRIFIRKSNLNEYKNDFWSPYLERLFRKSLEIYIFFNVVLLDTTQKMEKKKFSSFNEPL